jgi:hypothetical protein
MYTLEDTLNNNKIININYFNNFKDFGYETKNLLMIDLEFLVENIYNDVKIIDNKNIRLSQGEFRNELLDKYGKCLITDNECPYELEACHLVEVKDGGDYFIENGIILEANLHNTFDKYLWCINPYTKKIEIKENHFSSINKYNNKEINIDNNILENLIIRYNKFINNLQ